MRAATIVESTNKILWKSRILDGIERNRGESSIFDKMRRKILSRARIIEKIHVNFEHCLISTIGEKNSNNTIPYVRYNNTVRTRYTPGLDKVYDCISRCKLSRKRIEEKCHISSPLSLVGSTANLPDLELAINDS